MEESCWHRQTWPLEEGHPLGDEVNCWKRKETSPGTEPWKGERKLEEGGHEEDRYRRWARVGERWVIRETWEQEGTWHEMQMVVERGWKWRWEEEGRETKVEDPK